MKFHLLTPRSTRLAALVLTLSAALLTPAIAGKKGEEATDKPPATETAPVKKTKKKQKGADEAAAETAEKPKKEAPALEAVTLVGTLSKTERKTKKGETVAVYFLTDAGGAKTRVPAPRQTKKAKKSGAAPINLESYLGKKIVLKGMVAAPKANAKGKKAKVRTVRKITSIIAAEA